MNPRKSVLTTGDVARICSVAPRTVSKWFDSGHLRGYRIPGSKDRRIPLDQLLRFMRAHGIPTDALESGNRRILVLDADAEFRDALRTALVQKHGYEVVVADSAFEAGATAHEFHPHVVLIDVALTDVNPRAIARFFRSVPELQSTCLIGHAPKLDDAAGEALRQQGFDGYLSKPFDVAELLECIEQAAVAGVH